MLATAGRRTPQCGAFFHMKLRMFQFFKVDFSR
jgi:hypothetical protein